MPVDLVMFEVNPSPKEGFKRGQQQYLGWPMRVSLNGGSGSSLRTGEKMSKQLCQS
jgi:hypothetical protein